MCRCLVPRTATNPNYLATAIVIARMTMTALEIGAVIKAGTTAVIENLIAAVIGIETVAVIVIEIVSGTVSEIVTVTVIETESVTVIETETVNGSESGNGSGSGSESESESESEIVFATWIAVAHAAWVGRLPSKTSVTRTSVTTTRVKLIALT